MIVEELLVEGKPLIEGNVLSRKRVDEVIADTNIIKKYGLSQIRSRVNLERVKNLIFFFLGGGGGGTLERFSVFLEFPKFCQFRFSSNECLV